MRAMVIGFWLLLAALPARADDKDEDRRNLEARLGGL